MTTDSGNADTRPWLIERAFAARVYRASTRQAAVNMVEKPYLAGRVTVRNERTGETWERRSGSWIKTRDADPKRRRPPAQFGTEPPLPVRPQDIIKPERPAPARGTRR